MEEQALSRHTEKRLFLTLAGFVLSAVFVFAFVH